MELAKIRVLVVYGVWVIINYRGYILEAIFEKKEKDSYAPSDNLTIVYFLINKINRIKNSKISSYTILLSVIIMGNSTYRVQYQIFVCQLPDFNRYDMSPRG